MMSSSIRYAKDSRANNNDYNSSIATLTATAEKPTALEKLVTAQQEH